MTGVPDLSSAEQVGQRLLPYLSEKLHTPVRFAEGPTAITAGWETYIFAFRLVTAKGEWTSEESTDLLDRDLILRVYQGNNALAKGETELMAQRLLVEAGYPAPKPHLFEPDPSLFGQPFMIMDKLPGRPMLEIIAASGPLTALKMMRLLGSTHARLHALDITQADVPPPVGPSPFDRALLAGRQLADEDGVRALNPLLTWVEERQDALSQEGSCVLHLDFHPLNVLIDDGEVSGVLDWPSVTVGNAHFDVAATITLLAAGPVPADLSTWARLLLPTVRRLLVHQYLAGYTRQRPLERGRLPVYEVAAALRWLVFSQLFRYMRPEAIGVKAESSALVSQREVDALCRFINKRTKLDLRISLAELKRGGSA